MPLLFYFPVIVMSGIYEAAADDMAQMYSFWFRPREQMLALRTDEKPGFTTGLYRPSSLPD